MKRYDRIAALFLMALGMGVAIYAVYVLKLGALRRPDAGMQPFLAGLGMAITSSVWLVASLGKDENPEPFWGRGEWVRPLLALVFLLLYTASMESLGYILSTFAFMAVWQFLIEKEKWLKASVITVLSTVGMYVLFVYLLGVPVPEGIFGQ